MQTSEYINIKEGYKLNEGGKNMTLDNNNDAINLAITDRCCNATTGCEWDGTLRGVRTEPIFVQKVYDAILLNLQALRTVTGVVFTPALGRSAQIVTVVAIRCRRFFNPENINDPRNLTIKPNTVVSGADFVKDGQGKPVTVIGPDGKESERIIFTDTTECDEEGKGTPVFGTQTVSISGNVVVEIDIIFIDVNGRRTPATLSANIQIAPCTNPIVLTNFFELCIPSVFGGAFFPRFAEFCNANCESRLATNSITRDITVDPVTGVVRVNLLIAICITCEKKIVVPVQLCVLSTGFPELSPITAPICTTFPTLFPRQIDESNDDPPCPRPRPRQAEVGVETIEYQD